MNSVILTGISPSEMGDNRTKLILGVEHEGEQFEWVLYVPPSITNAFQDYVDQNAAAVHADIAAKLQQWDDLEPKTKIIESDSMGETITVPIAREEIVCPTYPDYYVLRAREYPTLAEQLDAFWKGGAAAEAMAKTISTIKNQYPAEVKMKIQQYAQIENNQIIFTEFFKRPDLVPAGDWRMIGEDVTPEFDPTTHYVGERTLQLLPDGTVAHVWSIIEFPPPPPPTVPEQIQMWQARAMLIRMGMLDDVVAAVAASGNAEVQNAFEYAPNVVRKSSMLLAIAGAMNLDDATLDNMFIEGAKIK